MSVGNVMLREGDLSVKWRETMENGEYFRNFDQWECLISHLVICHSRSAVCTLFSLFSISAKKLINCFLHVSLLIFAQTNNLPTYEYGD